MSPHLVEIQPSILKFTFEIGKQSSCLTQLTNKTDQFVAFKVKTTSPKKYIVKPNIGVMKPKGTYEFAVVMLPQNEAPPDMLCKDKFLVQTTIVAFGLTEENITTDMFVKGPNKRIEDKKLKVILIAPSTPTESPVAQPVIAVQNQGLPLDPTPKNDKPAETVTVISKDGEESQPRAIEEIQSTQHAEARPVKDIDVPRIAEARPVKDADVPRIAEARPVKDIDVPRIAKSVDRSEVQHSVEEKAPNSTLSLQSTKASKDLSAKLNELGSKLAEAEQIAARLTEEKNRILHEKESLEQELAMARKKNVVRKIYMGYPLLYVCMVSMFSLTFGYLLRQ